MFDFIFHTSHVYMYFNIDPIIASYTNERTLEIVLGYIIMSMICYVNSQTTVFPRLWSPF
jgi:hypothetical protein